MPEKTVVCKFHKPNKEKLEKIKTEYQNAQKYISGNSEKIYSATKQAMDKYAGKDNQENKPLFLRNDTFEVVQRDTELTEYWAKIPVASTYGRIWIPINPHTEIKEEWEIRDSKIVRKEYGFELHLSISKEVQTQDNYEGAMGIDLGLRKLATTTDVPLSDTASKQTKCLGSEVENYADKYFHLRRNAKNGYVRERWDGKVSDKTENLCHQISRKIVDHAKENNLFIVIGDLEGIQDKDRGKKMNRKMNNFPHWKLRNYIKYKADWEGIKVMEVDESETSQICSQCGEKTTPRNGMFRCQGCGYETDRDKNASYNIGKRGIGKLENASSDSKGGVTPPNESIA